MNPAVVTAVLLLVDVLNTVTGSGGSRGGGVGGGGGGGGSGTWNRCIEVQPRGDGWSCIDENRCIKYFKSRKTFSDAQEHCSTLNADLMSVHSFSEMLDLMCSAFRVDSEVQSVWIGGQRSGDQFTFTDGSDFEYMRWFYGQPDNAGGQEDCIEVDIKVWGSWFDANCSEEKSFACSKKM